MTVFGFCLYEGEKIVERMHTPESCGAVCLPLSSSGPPESGSGCGCSPPVEPWLDGRSFGFGVMKVIESVEIR